MIHEEIQPFNHRSASYKAQGSLCSSRHRNERSGSETDRGVRREGGKEETDSPSKTKKITRMERARKLREQQPDPNHAFLFGGTHG
jgi:hypothetical protein